MSSTATLTRLDALEAFYGGRCPVCDGWPQVRITGRDEDAGAERGENRPPMCPRCGSEPRSEIQIVGLDEADLP